MNPLVAQIGAEVRMRLRSFATPIAVAAFVAAAFFWIPDPKGNATSLSWELPDGRVQAPVYSAAYVGFAVSVLSGIILAMSGFYLVAGSVRRDRERGVGAILAATPLSKTAYLGGKWAAHFVYLLVIATFGLAAGLVAFIRYGAGPFDPIAFALPYFLSTIPAIAVVASFAVLFDVTPGLRSRGGLVIWFFVFLFGLVKLPLDLAGEDVDDPTPKPMQMVRQPIFDPTGLATDQYLVRKSLPEAVKGVSSGHVTHSKPFERVPWPGIEVTPKLAAMRALNFALALVPLALAVLLFDRFDPARGRRRIRKPSFLTRWYQGLRNGVRSSNFGFPDEPQNLKNEDLTPVKLTPVTAEPSAARAVLAEARLIWESASWIKWPLALSAILAGLLPGNLAQGIFLVLLVPVISEAAAREDMAGTRALVFSQPGVPASPVLWKIRRARSRRPDARDADDDPRSRRIAGEGPRVRRGTARRRRDVRRPGVADLGRQALHRPLRRRLVHGDVGRVGSGFHRRARQGAVADGERAVSGRGARSGGSGVRAREAGSGSGVGDTPSPRPSPPRGGEGVSPPGPSAARRRRARCPRGST